jgi:predicted RNA-binding Zn-ribbon protein involved in translation (DUF1610 family)
MFPFSLGEMEIPCSSCNQSLDIPEELAGQTIECPACKASLTVPSLAAPPSRKAVTPRKLVFPELAPPSKKQSGNWTCPKCGGHETYKGSVEDIEWYGLIYKDTHRSVTMCKACDILLGDKDYTAPKMKPLTPEEEAALPPMRQGKSDLWGLIGMLVIGSIIALTITYFLVR